MTTVVNDPAAIDAFAAGTDSAGNLYGAGFGGEIASKFDVAGRKIWSIFPIPFTQFGMVERMAVDGAGNVYLSGWAADSSGGTVAALAKYRAQPNINITVTLSATAIEPVIGAIGPQNQTQVKVHVEDASHNAVAGATVTLSAASQPNSGGHDHDGSRPTGSFDPADATASSITLTTDPNGNALDVNGDVAVYISTAFGGIDNLTATAMGASTSTIVTVAILNLVPLTDAAFYQKVGGTCNHHGPGGPNGCTDSDENHYGTASTINSISMAAAAWSQFSQGQLFLVNDMSLKMGGGFDIGGNWMDDIVRKIPKNLHMGCNPVGHCAHRLGMSTDLSIQAIGNPGNLSTLQQKNLADILTNSGAAVIYPEGSHWHVEFAN